MNEMLYKQMTEYSVIISSETAKTDREHKLPDEFYRTRGINDEESDFS